MGVRRMERRKHRRIEFVQATYCRMMGEQAVAMMHDCWISNISVGGMSVDIKSNVAPQGEPDAMMVLYKIGTRIRNDLVSIRSARQVLGNLRYGCAFLEHDEKRLASIENYVSLHD
mgnify:CR=1 FL=1